MLKVFFSQIGSEIKTLHSRFRKMYCKLIGCNIVSAEEVGYIGVVNSRRLTNYIKNNKKNLLNKRPGLGSKDTVGILD